MEPIRNSMAEQICMLASPKKRIRINAYFAADIYSSESLNDTFYTYMCVFSFRPLPYLLSIISLVPSHPTCHVSTFPTLHTPAHALRQRLNPATFFDSFSFFSLFVLVLFCAIFIIFNEFFFIKCTQCKA